MHFHTGFSQPTSLFCRSSSWVTGRSMAGGQSSPYDDSNWSDSCPLGKRLSLEDTSPQRKEYVPLLSSLHKLGQQSTTQCLLMVSRDPYGLFPITYSRISRTRTKAGACWFSNKMLWTHSQEGVAQNPCK